MKKAAPTTPNEEKRSINWSFIVWPLVVLLFYVLSFGPVQMMMEKGHIQRTNEFVWKFYKPLILAYWKTPLHKPLGMYCRLWSPKHFDKNGDSLRRNDPDN
jgi:hypothetical protein